jgi:nitroreductase
MSQGPSAAPLADVIRSRRSINLFEPEPVDTRLLLEAIELARWAPNHRLTEPWRFYILGEQTAERAARFAAELETASKGERVGAARYQRFKAIPGNFVVTSHRSEDALVDRENYAACCCAVQNLSLYLWEQGVGVKWTTGAMTREQGFYDLLEIDSHKEMVVGLFWYGRPKIVPPQKRREVADITIEKP